MLTTLRQAFDLIGRDQRRRWIFLIVLSIMASGFEMLGAAMVYILLSLVVDPGGSIELPVVGDVRSFFGDVDERTLLLTMVFGMGAFFVIRALVQIGFVYVQQRAAQNAGARLSVRFIQGYLGWPYEMHLHRNSAELIRNGHQAVKQLVNQVFLPVIRVSAELVLISGLIVFLVVVSPLATGLAALVVGGAATILLLVVQPRLKRFGLVSHATAKDTLAYFQQSLHGLRDIKLLGRERYFTRRYGRSRLRHARMSYLHASLSELPHTVIELALLGFILLFFGVAVSVEATGAGALSVLGLFAYAGLRIQPSLQRILTGLNNIKYSTAPLADLHADLRAVEKYSTEPTDVEPLPFNDAIELSGVRFRYEGASRDALSGINLTIRKGQQVGICGPTGGGKSTLVDIITGLLTPTEGSVTVDGQPISEHLREWQRNLGVVPQSVFLTDDTLRRNIAFGVPDDEIDDEAVERAVELAQLADYVASLPDGLETSVGERGVRLSGGQRQRIAIARALYRNPEVLIFDEGTSALDNATEAELLAAIEHLRGERTIIHIAHRLTTVKDCDCVIMVNDGVISGVGSFAELERENEQFKRMAGVMT